VSLLRSKHCTAVLAPTGIAIVPWERRKPIPTSATIIDCAPLGDEPNWRGPLTALKKWADQQGGGRLEIDVILSNRFLQFALLPWSSDLNGQEEIMQMARIQFEALFGSAAKDRVKVSDSEYGAPSIACALDSLLLSELVTIAAEGNLVLNSLAPYFMLAFNNWRKRIPDEGLLVVLERECCVMLSVRGGTIAGIRSVKLHADDLAVLPAIIERELLLHGMGEQASVLLHSLGDRAVVRLENGIEPEQLQTPGPNGPHPLANMAMLVEH